MTMADAIAVMSAGRIEQLGTPTELYERPRTAFVAGFLGTSNLLHGRVEGDGVVRLDDGTAVRANTGGASGRVSIGVRPEKISLTTDAENSLPGTVRESAYIGVATEIIVDTPAGDIAVFHQNAEAGGFVPTVGSHVTVGWAAASTFVVDSHEEEGFT